MIAFSHPTGNANVRALLAQAAVRGELHQYYTTFGIREHGRLHRLSEALKLRDVGRRAYPSHIYDKTSLNPTRELVRLVSLRANLSSLTTEETGRFSTHRMYLHHDRRVAARLQQSPPAVVYAYEDGAEATFRAMGGKPTIKVYDLPIAYWKFKQDLLDAESARLPAWEGTLSAGEHGESAEKLARKDEELRLADVVSVASTFVADSLPTWVPRDKVIISPFGSPPARTYAPRPVVAAYTAEAPLKVLFVGSMGQRKGLADLFAAVKLLGSDLVHLTIVGTPMLDIGFYRGLGVNFTHHRSLPHAGVLDVMEASDVFCLPSIAEGRALVVQEAMSMGLPIIITSNTGGEDLVVDDQTGFLVDVGAPEAIAESLRWFLNHPTQVARMGAAARAHAAKYTWDSYADGVFDGIIRCHPDVST